MKTVLPLLGFAFMPMVLGVIAYGAAIDEELNWGQKLGAYAFLAFGLVFVIFAIKHAAKRQREAEDKMRREQAIRSVLSDADFAVECGANVPPTIAGRMRQLFAEVSDECLEIPDEHVRPELIRPSDCLVGNLALDLDSIATLDLVHKIEKEFGIRVKRNEWFNNEIPTVGDIVRHVATKVAAKQQG
jgi:acyl carrier protein